MYSISPVNISYTFVNLKHYILNSIQEFKKKKKHLF